MTTIEEAPTERSIAGLLVGDIARLSPGELAGLRRVDTRGPHTPAFWRLVAQRLEPVLPAQDPQRAEAERRWSLIAAAMAEAKGFHAVEVRFGAALAAVIDERRVLQLLRARDEALADIARAVVHHLVSRGARFNQWEMAWLVLSDGRADEDLARRSIYRSFYGAMPRD